MARKLKSLYGSLKKSSIKTHFTNGNNNDLITEDPLQRKIEKKQKSRNFATQRLSTFTPNEYYSSLNTDLDNFEQAEVVRLI